MTPTAMTVDISESISGKDVLAEAVGKVQGIPLRPSTDDTEFQDLPSNDQISLDVIATAAELDTVQESIQPATVTHHVFHPLVGSQVPNGVHHSTLAHPIPVHKLPPHAVPMPLHPHMPPGSAPMMFVPLQGPGPHNPPILMDASTGQPILPPGFHPMRAGPVLLPSKSFSAPMMMPMQSNLLAPSSTELRRPSHDSLQALPQAFTSPIYESSENGSNSSFEEVGSGAGSLASGAGNRMSYFIPIREGDVLMESAPMPTFTTLQRKKTVSKFPSHASPHMEGSFMSLQKNIELYRSSAKSSNDPEVQFEFAKFCIENTNGVDDVQVKETLLEEGFNWLKKLSQAGYTEAQYYLGVAYTDDQQYDRAFAQFGLAAKRLHPGACHAVAQAFEVGRGTKRDARAALQFYKKAATAGHKPSMFRLGIANLKGELTLRQSVREAIKWLKRCAAVADKENPQALYQLHLVYESGYPQAGVPPDESYSKSVLLEAAQLEYPPALHKLGVCYEFGRLGFPVDPMESFRYYKNAAIGGDEEAAFSIAGIYLTGSPQHGVGQDEVQSLYWVRKAAESGLPKAQFALGFLHEQGIGTDQPDHQEAMKWYKLAAENGDDKARDKLGLRESVVSTTPTVSASKRFSLLPKKRNNDKCIIM